MPTAPSRFRMCRPAPGSWWSGTRRSTSSSPPQRSRCRHRHRRYALGDVPVFNWFGRYEGKGVLRHQRRRLSRCRTKPRHPEPGPEYPLPRRQHLPVDSDQQQGRIPIHRSVPILQLDDRRSRLCPLQGHRRHHHGRCRRRGTAARRLEQSVVRQADTPDADLHARRRRGQYRGQPEPVHRGRTNQALPGRARRGAAGRHADLPRPDQPHRMGQEAATAAQENGGIAGIVEYGITRAEDDPKNAFAENWEPGIPRVQVNLYLDCDGDTKPDKPAAAGNGTCACRGRPQQRRLRVRPGRTSTTIRSAGATLPRAG